jgi:hypothetical protein
MDGITQTALLFPESRVFARKKLAICPVLGYDGKVPHRGKERA